MDTQNVVEGLLAERDRLFARLTDLTRESRDIAAALSNLHGTLFHFDKRLNYPMAVEDIVAAAQNHSPRATIKVSRRELIPQVQELLRGANGPMTTDAFVKAVAEAKGIPEDDGASRKKLAQNISQLLYGMRQKKLVKADQVPGRRAILWTAVTPRAATLR